MLRLLVIAAALTASVHAEMPNAPDAQEARSQEAIENTSAQGVVSDKNGKLHLARWSLSAFLIHDPQKGFGPSTRVDYRISNRWGVAATEVRSTVSAGFTVRLGSIQ
jgi:hypothetical protein